MTGPLTPFEWQELDIARLLEHGATGFVVAETGAGKSLIGIETAARSGAETILVVAPKGTHERVWREGILRQRPDAVVRRLEGTPDGKDALDALEWGEPGWYVITPQLLTRWKLDGVRPDMVIVDEAHLLANRQSAGSKVLRKIKSPRRVVMSGTMVRNKVENFWSLLRWVYPHLNGPRQLADVNYERWVTEWMATRWDRFAPGNRVVVGERVPGRIAATVPCYVQHFKRQRCCDHHPHGFLEGLPEPIRITESVELLPEQRRLIDRMEKTYMAWLESEAREAGDRKALVAKLPIVARTRLRQMALAVPSFDADDEIVFAPDAPSPKYDALLEIVRKVGEPVVAATSSKRFAEYVVRRLTADGLRAFEWSSSATERARNEALRDFEQGGYDVIVGVTEAIGTGIDGLQAASGVLVSLERSDDLTSEIQLEGRLDRRGQRREEGVLHYELIAEGSMDLGIVSRQLQRRLKLNASLRRAA